MYRTRQIKIVNKYGHVYHLIEGGYDRVENNVPKPCFMGYYNYALFAVDKLNKQRRTKYNI